MRKDESETVREDKERIQVLIKAMDILVALASGPKSVRDLAEATKVSKSATYRILHTLEIGNFVTHNGGPQKEYVLSAFFLNFSKQETRDRVLFQTVLPYMEYLNKKFDETINLAVVVGKRVSYIHSIESQQRLRSGNPINEKDFIHSTALGKAFLAALDYESFENIASQLEYPKRTQNTIITPAGLKREIEKIRKIGYSVDNEENEIGSRCIAVVLTHKASQPFGALSISGPVSRMPDNRIEQMSEALKIIVKKVSII